VRWDSPTASVPPPVDSEAVAPPERFSILRRHGRWRDALRRRMLATADVVAVVAGAAVAASAADAPLLPALAVLPVWLVLAKLCGLYDQDHRALRHLTVDELRELLVWAITGTALQVLVLSLAHRVQHADAALVVGVTTFLAAALARTAARVVWRRVVPAEQALLVGSGALERATRRKLSLFSDIHVVCVATVSDAVGGDEAAQDDVAAAVEREIGRRPDVDRIVVASSTVDESLAAALVALCRRHGIKLSLVPPATSLFGSAVQLRHIADLPVIHFSTWNTGRSTLAMKRVIDVTVALLALALLAPILLVLAALVRCTSDGPVLFRQPRAGLQGRPFRIVKFRTMAAGSEERVADVVDLAGLEHPAYKLRDDPRITRVGRWLRRTSLDELPQLINVLRGDMSLVGPRPEDVDVVALYSQEDLFRLSVKPGLTGPMQVYGRGELRFDERLAVEREYVDNLSLGRDLGIMLLTIATVLRGRGAY